MVSLKIRRKYRRHMQNMKIKRIIKHPDFDPCISRYNDIAIIELEKPIKRTKFVSPICLSTQLKDVKEQILMTEGYGETEFSGKHQIRALPNVTTRNLKSNVLYLKKFSIDFSLFASNFGIFFNSFQSILIYFINYQYFNFRGPIRGTFGS